MDIGRLSDPRIDFFILADRAEAVNGKLYMMGGGWTQTYVQDFQQAVPISFALGILVPWNATNQQHMVQIMIEDPDGRTPISFTLQAQFVAGRPATAQAGEVQRVLLAVPVTPVLFPAPGAYEVVARVGADERRVAFSVQPLATPPMPLAAP